MSLLETSSLHGNEILISSQMPFSSVLAGADYARIAEGHGLDTWLGGCYMYFI